MNRCYATSIVGAGLVCLCLCSSAQTTNRIPYREKKVQFSTFPGVSTAGFESAKYTYNFSFNLFSGIAAGTRYFSFSTISNLGTRSSSGLQLAGLANIIGSQSYLHLTNFEQKELENEGKTPNQKGIQLAGALNLVRGESSGVQVAGGMNTVYRSSSGFHLAGIGNFSGGNMIGLQLGGLYNVSQKLVLGGQVAVFNAAGSRLSGFQFGLLNRAKYVEGKADNSSVKSFGIQLGIINHSKTNNGIQIGIINRARRMRGVQFGLINIFQNAPYDGANRYNGVPIGLLNIGSKDSRLRISRSDLLPLMVEYTTGNCQNCSFTESQMPIGDIFYKTNQNALIFGYEFSDDEELNWAVGYGFQRVYYYKSSMSAFDPKNKKYFFSPSIRFLHLNREKKFDPTLSLLTQFQFDVGYRFGWFTLYTGLNMNAFLYKDGLPLDVNFEIASRQSGTQYQIWPGYIFGIQL
ncbi:LA_2272 family surface repeat-containing protein [Ekhidna sp.]